MGFYDAIRIGASGAADTAFTVDRSLRFNDNDSAYLNKTPSTAKNRKVWTCSFWCKRSTLGGEQRILSAYNGSSTSNQSAIKFTSDNKLQVFNSPFGSTTTNLITSRVFRDPSSWIHILVSVNMVQGTGSNRVKIYINGQQETSFSTETYSNFGESWWFNNNSLQSVGRRGANGTEYFDGYLAEFYFIDGQALTPASFGETNAETGQWNPIEYTGTFTKTGSLNDGTTWSSSQANAFQGNPANGTQYGHFTGLNSTFTITFPSGGVAVSSSLQFQGYANATSNSAFNTYTDIYVNGAEKTTTIIDGTQLGTHNSAFNIDFTGTMTSLRMQSKNTSNNGIAQVIVDGEVLINGFTDNGNNTFYLKFADNSGTTATTLGKDSSGNSNNFTPNNFSVATWPDTDSVEDTPTNNFCTLNPLDKNSNVVLANGNLQTATTATAGHYPVFSTMSMKGGKWYVEAKLLTNDGFLGSIMNIQHDGGSYNVDSTVGNPTSAVNKAGYGLLTGDGRKSHDGTLASYGSALSGSDIWMCAFDADNGKIYWGKNGTFFASGDPASGTNAAYTGIDTSITWNFAWHHYGNNNNVSVNFGQQGFTYTPPTGFQALSSANLSDPTILLPNKHFDTLLYTGTDTSASRTLTGLNFSPDWIWQKRRNGTNWHSLIDQVRGVGKTLFSNDTSAEATNNQYGYISAFTSDGFTWSAGSSNNSDGNETNGTFVSWCWNAGDTDGKTYTVKVVSDGGNKYRFDDFGTSAVTLDLAEGGTYIFDGADSSMASHPIKLSETSNGTHGGGSSYNTGVTYLLDGASVTESAYVSGYSSATTRQLKIVVAASAPTLYYYCHYHSGMGGQVNTNSTLGSSNFDGSTQTTVKVNASAGFSILTYSGNSSTGSTIGHGLGVKPSAIIIKTRSASDNWVVYHNQVNSGVDPEDYYLKLNGSDAQINSVIMLNDTAPTSSVITLQDDSTANQNTRTYVAYVFSEVAGYSKFGRYVGNGSTDGTFVFTGFRPALVIAKSTYNVENWIIYDNKREGFNPTQKYLMANASSAENAGSNNKIDFLSNGFKFRSTGAPHFGSNTAGYIYFAFAESPFKNARAR